MPKTNITVPKDTTHHPESADFNQVLDAIQENFGGTHLGIYTEDFDIAVTSTPENAPAGGHVLYGDADGSGNNIPWIVDEFGTKTKLMAFDLDYDNFDFNADQKLLATEHFGETLHLDFSRFAGKRVTLNGKMRVNHSPILADLHGRVVGARHAHDYKSNTFYVYDNGKLTIINGDGTITRLNGVQSSLLDITYDTTDGELLGMHSNLSVFYRIDPFTGDNIGSVVLDTASQSTIAYNEAGDTIYTTDSTNGIIREFNKTTGVLLSTSPNAGGSGPVSISVAPNGDVHMQNIIFSEAEQKGLIRTQYTKGALDFIRSSQRGDDGYFVELLGAMDLTNQFDIPGGAFGTRDITYDSSNDVLYTSSTVTDIIYKINASTGVEISSFASPDSNITSIVYSELHNELIASDYTSKTVYILNPSIGNVVHSFVLPFTPNALAFDDVENKLYCVELVSGGPDKVHIIHKTTGAILSTPFTIGRGIVSMHVEGETGKMYVCTSSLPSSQFRVLDKNNGNWLEPVPIIEFSGYERAISQGNGKMYTLRRDSPSVIDVFNDSRNVGHFYMFGKLFAVHRDGSIYEGSTKIGVINIDSPVEFEIQVDIAPLSHPIVANDITATVTINGVTILNAVTATDDKMRVIGNAAIVGVKMTQVTL